MTTPSRGAGRYASIVATGSYLPATVVDNDQLRRRFAHTDGFVDKMEERTGILSRRYAPEDWATSDLALPAARQALERAGRGPEDVDLIILGTDTPDFMTPATSTVLQHKLGATNAGTFDIGCGVRVVSHGLGHGSRLDRGESIDPHGPGGGRLPDATPGGSC